MINKDFNSILELIQAFPTEQSCIDHLEELRWNGNVVSPFDESSKVYNCKGNRYKCKNTGKYFNVKTATLFDNTKVELQKWFLAIWLITSHKKGISSLQLHRDINVTQKTAWFMLQRIRNCFGIEDNNEDNQMDSEVEIDETFIGGKSQNMHKSKRAELKKTSIGLENKSAVLGILERNKQVKTVIVQDVTKNSLKPIILNTVNEKATVVTDNYGAYRDLRNTFSKHVIVSHSTGEYVKGRYHTNTIEGYWSLVKRGIIGIYHFVSKKHLQKYLDEFSFRYNSRKIGESVRFNAMLSNMEFRLTYKELINE